MSLDVISQTTGCRILSQELLNVIVGYIKLRVVFVYILLDIILCYLKLLDVIV
jgi:hypothetical protein